MAAIMGGVPSDYLPSDESEDPDPTGQKRLAAALTATLGKPTNA